MNLKKSQRSNLENKRFGIFLLGLVSVSAFILAAFEWNHIEAIEESEKLVDTKEEIDLNDIPEIQIIKPRPTPPQPPKVKSNNFQEVEKKVEPAKTTSKIKIKEHDSIIIIGDPPPPPVVITLEKTFEVVEEMPEFPGGTKALYEYLNNHIRYPKIAKSNNIEGKVYVSFVIDKTGAISEIKVIRDIGGNCGKEAARVIKNMPKWKPGKQRGHKVKVRFTLPINFELD